MFERPNMPKTLVILGACGTAREAWWIVQETYPGTKVVFVQDVPGAHDVTIGDVVVPVVKDWDFTRVRQELGSGPDDFTEFVAAMGDPVIKKKMVTKALAAGLKPAPTLISDREVIIRPDCEIGRGGVIHPQTVLTTDVKVGDYVVLHLAKVGHGVTIGDYAMHSPGTHVSGNVVIGEGVFLGVLTGVRGRVRIAPWVVTGGSAWVAKDIDEPGITVVGVPARKLEKKDPVSTEEPRAFNHNPHVRSHSSG